MTLTVSKTEQSILDSIAPMQSDLMARLESWSAINSGSRNRAGLEKMRGVLAQAFAPLGAEVTQPALTPAEAVTASGEKTLTEFEPALLITQRPKAPVQIVFTGHYDTVFPAVYHFQKPDYLSPSRLRGPGVADMKGGISVMLTALEKLEKSPNAGNIGYNVLLSPDEEIGSPGSAPLLAKLGKQSHLGLTYEPALADGTLAGARKGSGNFAVIVKGKAAHAGRDHHLGRNAIAALSRFIVKLDALNGKRDGVTFNIAKVDGGGANNIVPELAIGRFNVRMVAADDAGWIQSRIDDLVAQIAQEDGITAELTGGFSRPPKPMAPANARVFDWVKQAGSALGLNIAWSPSGGVCEGNNLWAGGCPNVDTLGVRGGNIHSDQEFMEVESLVERSRLSTLILLKLANGEFDAHAVKKLAMQGTK